MEKLIIERIEELRRLLTPEKDFEKISCKNKKRLKRGHNKYIGCRISECQKLLRLIKIHKTTNY